MLTCKFGGSSLSCSANFQKAAAILAADSHRRCVVVSAPGRRNPQDEKLTDLLYACQNAAAQGRGFSALFDRVAGRYLEIAQGLGLRDIGPLLDEARAALRHAVQALRIPAVLSRMERGFSHASQAMEQCAGKLDMIREELHQAGGHMKNAGRALAGKEALEAQELEADKGALARLRGLFTSCGKTFAQMERGAGRLAEKTGGEKSSVKTELRGLKPAPEGQRRQAASKEQAR